MNVLHVMSSIDRRAGGPVVVTGLAAAQHRAGAHVTVLAVYADGADLSIARELESTGVRVTLVGPVSARSAEARALKTPLAKAVATADVVHIHGLWEVVQQRAAKLAHAARVPYVITPHGMLDAWSLRQSWAKKQVYLLLRLRRYLRRAAAFHATSDAERREIQAMNLGPPVIVEPLGIDFREFESLPPRGQFRQRYPQIGKRPLVVYLGRIHPGKGLEYLIPALAQPALREVMLAAVGPDSHGYMENMRALAASHGVADRVIFTGMMGGAARLLPLIDAEVLGLTSDHENFGMSAVEAIAAGTPVLVSDQVNIYREIRDGGVGWVVARDPAQIAQAIGRWLLNPEERSQAAARCQPFARLHYDWSAIGRRWITHYQSLVERRATPSGSIR
jgi:glycosyltransferase involved in cell wall biosynthesis